MSRIWVAEALDRLYADIASANVSGNVEGLFARHISGRDANLGIAWNVDCDADWLHRHYDPSRLPMVAALGYTVASRADPALLSALEDGMHRATARDPALAGPGAALHDPSVLIGLALAAKQFEAEHGHFLVWIGNVVGGLRRQAATRIDPLHAYAAQLCGINLGELPIDLEAPLVHGAALDWWVSQVTPASQASVERRLALRASIVERTLTENVTRRSAHQAALLWRVLRAAVSEETAAVLRTSHTVSRLLGQFESCLRRWRWDGDLKARVRWPIRSEREVQDILWVILRAVFDDLEDEDTLPKFGHSSYRADFGVPSLGLLVEAKFARSAADFKAIEKEVLQDLVPYLRSPERYREVLIFVYDDSCSVQAHDLTARSLRSIGGVADVVIVSRPSQLPTASQQGEP